MKTALLSLLLVLTTRLTIAQITPEQIIEKFFQDYATEKSDKALDNLYSHLPRADSIKKDIDNLKVQISGLSSMAGAYNGYAFIAKKEVAGSFSIFSYLVKFNRIPVRFLFRFYKPGDKWDLYSFSYDYQLEEELQQSVRLPYILQEK